MVTKFLDWLKIPISVLYWEPQGTFIPSLVPIGQVVSEEKSLEKIVEDGYAQRWQWQGTPSDGTKNSQKYFFS